MKKRKKLLTAVLAAVFIFTITATAMASETGDLISDSYGILPELMQEQPAEEIPDAEAGPSSPGPEEIPDEDTPTDPSASPSPEAAPSAELPVSEIPESEALFPGIMPMMLVPGADVTVTSWEDFKDSAEQAETDGKVIRIDPGLAGTMSSPVTIDITHNNSVVIDGGGSTFTAAAGTKAFTVNNTGSGTVTFRNMTLDGTGGAGGMLSFSGGSFTLSGMTLKNVNGTAIASVNANAVLDGVTVDTATSGVTGSGTLDIADSTFARIASTAVTAGSGNTTIADTTFDGVTNGAAIRGGAGTLGVTDSILKNITGTGIVGGSGTITVDGCTFSGINGIGISGGNHVIVKNTLFEGVNNNLGGHGSAIYSTGNLTVEDSSFVNSASTVDNGYIQGAIVAYGGTGRTIEVTRSFFKDNKASRYGGAIGFYQFGGNADISYNYFEGNGVSGKGANSDGGAVGVFNSNSGAACTFNVDNNTFIGNTSQDDGSAYFAESRNDTVVSNLTNNTFYGNKSTKYILAAADSGGVVQLSLDTVGHFRNNTFIGNTTSSLGTHGQGSAVGQHIDSANANVRPTATFQNNIMVGNGGTNGAYKNVDITDAADLGGNVGYDNGTALSAAVTADAVFGTNPQPRANSTSHGAVGKAGSGYTAVLSTVTILPNDGVTGFADNTAGSPVVSMDARGYTRDGANSDAGAMEIKFVKFDANGGGWSGLASLTYDGSKYYADDTASTGYFLVADPGGSVSVLTGDLPANGTKTFTGWYDAPTGGNKVTGSVTAADQTLYAHWADPAARYTITYYGNGSDGGTVPAAQTYDGGDTAAIAGAGTMTKTGAAFTGWNTDPGGTGTAYAAGQTFPITGDLELYAQWEDDPEPNSLYTLNFDSRGGTPVDSITNIPAGTNVSEPAQPARGGDTFDGWHHTPDCTCTHDQPCWDFARDAINGDKTLYARWIPASEPLPETAYTVTFDSQGGSAVGAITGISPGARIAPPADPTREGYVFRGWYTESACENPWVFAERTVEGNMTLYAKWESAASPAAGTPAAPGTPKTGDTSPSVALLIIAAAGAAAIIIRTITTLKRRDNRS